MTSIGAAVLTGAARHPNAALTFAGGASAGTLTSADLVEQATAVAVGLADRGIGAGDVVAVQLPNWPEGAAASLGALLAGATLVPIIHSFGAAEVGFILRQSGARALFVPDRWRHVEHSAHLAGHLAATALELAVVVGDDVPAGATAYADLLGRPGGASLPEPPPDEVCCLVYTSGTTAEPKGVQHTHRTLLAEVATLPGLLAVRPGGGFLQAFPAGHIAGFLGLLNPVIHGVPAVLLDAWDPALAARLVAEHRLTASSGSPFYLASMLDAAEAAGLDLSSMAAFMTGAAPVPPALVERSERAGVATFRAYGSTEHPTVTSGHPSDPLALRAGTDGRCAPGSEVRIAADGEVLVRGPELFVGYRNPALNAEAFTAEGWFRTGDIGRLDADGFLTITDRKKDIIIRGGENIASKEVEDVLARHPSVAEVAVVSAPDQRMGERVCAFVRLTPGSRLTLEEARAHLVGHGLARHKAPEQLEVLDDFPRTPSGKIRKVELRDGLRGD